MSKKKHRYYKSTTNQLKSIAEDVVRRLDEAGFIILRYDAWTTNSIYLKLDYGQCHSIRISDHPGKQNLKYRYNLSINGLTGCKIQDNCQRFYFTIDQLDDMIDMINFDKKHMVDKYGRRNYERYMYKNRNRHESDVKGFWSSAKRVDSKCGPVTVKSTPNPDNVELPWD